MDNLPEEWRDVVGYEGRYRISDQGRVLSLLRRAPRILFGDTYMGYRRVCLVDSKGKKKTVPVHRIVAAAFLGPSALTVHHKDHDRANNQLTNLMYMTRAENRLEAVADGRHYRGERHHSAKLAEADAREIFRLRGVVSQNTLARQYGVSQAAISYIHRGLHWKDANGIS